MIHIKIFEFNQFPVNTYLLWDESNEGALIDCGCFYSEEKKALLNFIEEHKLRIKVLLNTHLHLDHAFGNKFFSDYSGLLPLVHKDDVLKLPSLAQQGLSFGIHIDGVDIHSEDFLEEGDIVRFGNSALRVIHVPGHSPGSIVFYSDVDHFIISGDVLFRQSIGRSDLWGGDGALLLRGIKEKLFSLEDDTVVYPGHGPSTTIGFEKLHNPFV